MADYGYSWSGLAGLPRGGEQQSELSLNTKLWSGFDLVSSQPQKPIAYRIGDLLIVSGCITTIAANRLKANTDMSVGKIPDTRWGAGRDVPFLAPTAMSRFEGMHMCGTSLVLKGDDGWLKINFNKNNHPLVVHLSGFCCMCPFDRDEDDLIHIEIRSHTAAEELETAPAFRRRGKGRESDMADPKEKAGGLAASPERPPSLCVSGSLVLLQGELEEATFGSGDAQCVGLLPEGYRPRRELRWLAMLSSYTEDSPMVVEHTVALRLSTDGRISVQGGKTWTVDRTGKVHIGSAKKKGRLHLDGIRFSLDEGIPVEPCGILKEQAAAESGAPPAGAASAKLAYLLGSSRPAAAATPTATAVCVKQGPVVLLEGYLAWDPLKVQLNSRLRLGQLPKGCWPRRREAFYTRGGSDIRERCRVDVDPKGRIFCPEGAPEGRLELTGIIFVAQEAPSQEKEECMLSEEARQKLELDDLNIAYGSGEVSFSTSPFDCHSDLRAFIRRSNDHEWWLLGHDLYRHGAQRAMWMPLGDVPLLGSKDDKQNLGSFNALWQKYRDKLGSYFHNTDCCGFGTLTHFSDEMFEHVAQEVDMDEDDKKRLREERATRRQVWAAERGQVAEVVDFAKLQAIAEDIVQQMFEHWDFKAQIRGALEKNFRPPDSILHLLPSRSHWEEREISRHIWPEDRPYFDKVCEFFLLYETTGNSMTHCSLMGQQDMFTNTGKWFFPDTPEVQEKLAENIAWLYERGLNHYMSERQTRLFPFIEDLDCQCPEEKGPLVNGKRVPPDDLLMYKPQRTRDGKVFGDPGELMKRRAKAVHMLYPFDVLEVLVYSASGYNKGKGMLKSSFHLVWLGPHGSDGLIVDADRATAIRDVTLGLFYKESSRVDCPFLRQLRDKLIELDDSNDWPELFDKTTINAHNGLRLPYNDKASNVMTDEAKKDYKEGRVSKNKAAKVRRKENRPTKAIGKIVFEFQKDPETNVDVLTDARWTEDVESRSMAEWIQKGSCRRDIDKVDLTPWHVGPEAAEFLKKSDGTAWQTGADGQLVTHKPYPNIFRCSRSIADFIEAFDAALDDEKGTLEEEQEFELRESLNGSWISVTATQAWWRTSAASQWDEKVPFWNVRRHDRRTVQQAADVIFIKAKEKVIVTGPPEVESALLRAVGSRDMSSVVQPDDYAIMPLYKLEQ